jgi:phosphatidylglycerol:prolipoprotein diacylglycerol transferase
VHPEIHVLGITLQSFGLMMALGFVVAGIAAGRHLVELGRPVDWAYEMVFAALVGGVVGSRLWWVGQNWSSAHHDLLGSLFSGTGLVWYGGAIGGALCVLAWARWRGVLDLLTVDVAAVPLAAGYAIGRIGCQLAGDGDYGKPWNGPWAMAYPHGTVPTTVRVHPTPVYEFLAMGLVAALLWRWRHRWRPGTLFALYLVLAGVERFLVEFVRRNEPVLLGLTQPQVISIVMIAAGGAWVLLRRRAFAPTPAPAA